MSAPLSWQGGTLDGTPWQGIAYLTIAIDEDPTAEHRAVVTAHLNQPAAGLTEDDIRVTGGRRLPPPAHDFQIGGDTVEVRFRGFGDHSPYYIELLNGGDHPLHPFFAAAEFRFTIDCEAGDCRPSTQAAIAERAQTPAVDLLTKDYNGFVRLLADWVDVKHPRVADLSSASFERVLLELFAWAADMSSYYQDRVLGEAFIETARQRFSLRQHAVLLGTRIDEGRAPETLLAFDVETSGFVPAGLQVRTATTADEVPVTFTVAARTRVLAAGSSAALRVAAWPGAHAAAIPAGATELLLWGHGSQLEAGRRLALVQGSFAQVVTLTTAPRRLEEPGWVADPDDPFDPLVDPPAEVTHIEWREPLVQALTPWEGPPLRLYANLAEAEYGSPRTAVADPSTSPRPGELALLTPQGTVVSRRPDGTLLLRALRVPEWPLVHDDDGTGTGRPAVELEVSGDRWSRVDHLHASRSYDLHYTAEADESSAVWLRFGDGVHGREVPLAEPGRPAVRLEVRYRTGDPVAGNVGLGTLVDAVRPPTGADAVTFDALGDVAVTNVLAASGGRDPATLDRTREWLPESLRHGALERAVSLEDYAAVAMDVPGVARATARSAGGPFNAVLVLVDPEGADDLSEDLRVAVYGRLDQLRMTGREHVVAAAEYVPLEVELLVCARAGFASHLVRDHVLAQLRPGSGRNRGWFHPDRLSFGDSVRLGDLLAFVQELAGVRSVKATMFRPREDASGALIHDVITLGRTKVARLDADPDFPENGTLTVSVAGLDAPSSVLVVDEEPVA